jgi:hypothetical protein
MYAIFFINKFESLQHNFQAKVTKFDELENNNKKM